MSSKAKETLKPSSSKTVSVVATNDSAQPNQSLFLDQLGVDSTGMIVVMVGRIWDVNSATGRYLSTDFVVSDSKGNMMHCTARSSVSHNFLRMKEGGIYAVKNFVVLPNKEDFRVFRHDKHMLEFDGETTSRKVTAAPQGFCRYPFKLLDFDKLELTNNKYLIDIAGYVTSVGRTSYTKTGAQTLEFYLANQRSQSIRVTLWGAHGDALVDKKTKHPGVCAMVLTGMSVKEYNNKLYLSSTSATVILDDDDIPCLQELRADDSYSIPSRPLPVDCTQARDGTIENLLIWARNRRNNPATFRCKAMIETFRTKKGWNYPSCGHEKCTKGCSRKDGSWLCEACHRSVDYPVFRYRLEAVIADGTKQTVVVLFNDIATELLHCSAESLMAVDDDGSDADGELNLPLDIRNLIGTEHVFEIKSHSYYEYGNFESFVCSRINPKGLATNDAYSGTPPVSTSNPKLSLEDIPKDPVVDTPTKPNEGNQKKGDELEDSDADEVSGPIRKTTTSTTASTSDNKKKRKQYIEDDQL